MSATRKPLEPALVTVALVVLGVIILRCAWIGDDAYITLRTVDNIVHGYGAVWNPGERVQAYTHPLWMLLLLLPYAIVRDAFVMPMVLGAVLSVAAAWTVAHKLGRVPIHAVLVIAMLGLSRTFVDYSTGGLENPLSHLLLALFFVVYARFDGTQAALTRLYLLFALLATTRLDLVVLVAPAAAFATWRMPWKTVVRSAAIGLSPLLAWELFSLVYYGSLVPNTAVSKLAHGLPRAQLLRQGWVYVVRQLEFDPLSALVVSAAIVFSVGRLRGSPKWAVVGFGIAAYVMYVVSIGGGFMAGRFFAAPFFCAVCLIAAMRVPDTEGGQPLERREAWASGVLIVVVGFMASNPTPLLDEGEAEIREGIVDERRFWGRDNALLGLRRSPHRPYHSLTRDARRVRDSGQQLAIRDAVGIFGYHAGPQVVVVDRYALADAFLARLPTTRVEPWRPGHLQRFTPAGYIQTLQTGEPHFVDESIAELWRQSRLVTSGPLFSAQRWRAIWWLNTGQLKHLVDVDFYRRPYYESVPLELLSYVHSPGARWDGPGALYVSPDRPLRVEIGQTVRHDELSMAAGTNDGYRIEFMLEDRSVGSAIYEPLRGKDKKGKRGLHERPVVVPLSAVESGYDALLIERKGKDRRLTIGHLLLSTYAETDAPGEANKGRKAKRTK